MGESNVAIGVMTAGDIRMECAESLVAAMATKVAKIIFFVGSGPYLDDGRNKVARLFTDPVFAEQGCDRLLMVDSDIEFKPDDVSRLAELDLPVVSGVYHNSYHELGVKPVVYDWMVNELGMKTLAVIDKWPNRKRLQSVTAIGAGFLMIRRDVLDVLYGIHGEPQPFFAEDIRDGIHFGEDLTFCLRCHEAGIDVIADTKTQLAHHKSARITQHKA